MQWCPYCRTNGKTKPSGRVVCLVQTVFATLTGYQFERCVGCHAFLTRRRGVELHTLKALTKNNCQKRSLPAARISTRTFVTGEELRFRQSPATNRDWRGASATRPRHIVIQGTDMKLTATARNGRRKAHSSQPQRTPMNFGILC